MIQHYETKMPSVFYCIKIKHCENESFSKGDTFFTAIGNKQKRLNSGILSLYILLAVNSAMASLEVQRKNVILIGRSL